VEPLQSLESLDLSLEEMRVLGCLVEKQLTTPEQYPLTLNALHLACNQKSNREPVVNYPESTVLSAVTSAKTKGLVRFVHPSHGRSVIRYGHLLPEALGASDRQLALLAVMILRGPQTSGELRIRSERMTEFSDLADLERELDRMAGLDLPLVEHLGRRPGQSADRYRQLLGGEAPVELSYSRPAPSPPRAQSRQTDALLTGRMSTLEEEVGELKT
jgi:uncharacterized protein YceH (UPF0502 family)